MVNRSRFVRCARCRGFGRLLGALLLATTAAAERPEGRAPLPEWNKEAPGIFFDDAFQQGLVGTPNDQLTPRSAGVSDASSGLTPRPRPEPTVWQETITGETIEDEIKAILGRVNALLANSGDFKGRGYREARRDFGVAAMLFAIVEAYPAGSVRWQQEAAAARDALAEGAMRTRVGTEAVFQQAKRLRTSLEDLVRGGSFSSVATIPPKDWSEICPRPLSMQRLEMADSEQLTPAFTSPESYRQQRSLVVHEAELTAAISVALLQEGMEDATDDDYRESCQAMKQAAQQIVQAAESGDYESARQSHMRLKRTCADCHAAYRG